MSSSQGRQPLAFCIEFKTVFSFTEIEGHSEWSGSRK